MQPTRAGDTFTYEDTLYKALAIIPRPDGGLRIPCLRSCDEPHPLNDAVTFMFSADPNQPPEPLTGPMDWTNAAQAPLACEIRAGHLLPPASGIPGRPNEHNDFALLTTPQTVSAVTYNDVTDQVQVVTRDGAGNVRRYRRGPQERLDPRVRPPRRVRPVPPGTSKLRRALHPAIYDGPFSSPTGAQFVFQQRSSRGGRLPKGAPIYRETLPPLFDEATGDLMPYIVMAPTVREAPEGRWLDALSFSPTARKLPEVRSILIAQGLLASDEDDDGEGSSNDARSADTD